jgi:uncharacterized membrane protein
MRSSISIAGHPLHPVLVALPIGLFVWSFVALLIFVASDESQSWYDVAYYSAIAAVVTALVAALPGFVDAWTLARGTDAQPLAIAHMVLNLVTVALFAGVAAVMYDERAMDGGRLVIAVVLQAVGIAALGVAGWLGGEMVFRHRLAVLPEGWSPALTDDQLAEGRLRPQARGR